MSFIHDDFLLSNETARHLYHSFAADQPIYDYHCHLPPADVAGDRRFKNLTELWLEGDHYKWRLMRSNGVEEKYCTGDADDYAKFMAFARTVPHTLRNPMFHWTHLELKRYFGIDELLNEHTASDIWSRANEQIQDPSFSAQGILKKFRVSVIGTTDDPTDDLKHHRTIRESGIGTRVYPAFRPDKSLAVDDASAWNEWVDTLAEVAGVDVSSLRSMEEALAARHAYFHEQGSRLSDHGLNHAHAAFASRGVIEGIFNKARSGKDATPEEKEQFATHLMLLFGRLDAEKGWVKQLHLGAQRNNNSRALREMGRDAGFDSIGDWPQAESLAKYLDRLDADGCLPKTVLYNLNPRDNYVFATMIGNFQDGSVPGKMQFGSGWWFLDQKEAMVWQINALSNLGLLSRFVGMLTDSRSLLSYPRHEYFRRILCDILGREAQSGEIPNDQKWLGDMVRRICFKNAVDYFGMEPGQV